MKPWLAGLIATVAGGLSGILGPIVADPDHFISGMGAGKRLMIAAGITAATHLFAYLSKAPLPGVKLSSTNQMPIAKPDDTKQ